VPVKQLGSGSEDTHARRNPAVFIGSCVGSSYHL
jgi:hypothetical protein